MESIEQLGKTQDDNIRQLKRAYKKMMANTDDVYGVCYGNLGARVNEGYLRWYWDETEKGTPVDVIFSTLLNWTGTNMANILYRLFEDPDDEELLKITVSTLIEVMKDRVADIKRKTEADEGVHR